jgi:5-dehydro-2-deoxygluconokinase
MKMNIDFSKKYDVVAFGRSTVDIYATDYGSFEADKNFTKYVGGSPANTAVAMAKLGLKTGYIGRVSSDSIGAFVVSYLGSCGIDTSHISRDSHYKTGITIGEFPAPRINNCYMYRNDCADLKIDYGQIDERYIAGHKFLLVSGTSLSYSPAREAALYAIELAKRNRTGIIFDFDYRSGTWENDNDASLYLTLAARKADIVFGTREEFDVMERLFFPGNRDNVLTARTLRNAGVSIVAVKNGRKGSDVYDSDGSRYHGGLYPAEVVNTFGAGDSYSGAFIYALLQKYDVPEALKYAAAASSIVVSRLGCSDAMPVLEEVESYMKKYTYQD